MENNGLRKIQDQVRIENPFYAIDDDQLLSRLILARESGNNDKFVEIRREVLRRMLNGW